MSARTSRLLWASSPLHTPNTLSFATASADANTASHSSDADADMGAGADDG